MSTAVSRSIFLNLPVSDVARAMDFFGKLGFTFNMQFTGPTAAAMILNDQASVMLVSNDHFRQFTPRQIADTATYVEGLFCLSATSRAEVDALLKIALEAGAREVGQPQDHGWMYLRAFLDLDGHHWELAHMDAAALAAQQQAT